MEKLQVQYYVYINYVFLVFVDSKVQTLFLRKFVFYELILKLTWPDTTSCRSWRSSTCNSMELTDISVTVNKHRSFWAWNSFKSTSQSVNHDLVLRFTWPLALCPSLSAVMSLSKIISLSPVIFFLKKIPWFF